MKLPARSDTDLRQLATRLPRGLHRQMKIYSVVSGESVQDFVNTAIRDRLKQVSRNGGRGR